MIQNSNNNDTKLIEYNLIKLCYSIILTHTYNPFTVTLMVVWKTLIQAIKSQFEGLHVPSNATNTVCQRKVVECEN